MNRHFFLLSTLLLALWALPAAASDWQDPDSIRDAAEGFVQAQMGDNGQVRARAGNVDQRLRLRRCEQGLETFLPSGRELGGSNTTVGVRCPGPVQWRLFVSVETEVLAPVVVANGVLQRGQVLGPEDISLQERNTGSLRREFFTSPDEVVGMRLRRNLSPGSVIQANHLDIQRLVERGQRVRLLARGESVEVSMAGEALQNGARGQRIRVRNLSSGKELEGVVSGEGTVKIRF